MTHQVVAALVAERRRQGLTQQAVATLMGVAQSTVSNFERSDDPQLGTVQRYARVLGGHIEFDLVDLREGEV